MTRTLTSCFTLSVCLLLLSACHKEKCPGYSPHLLVHIDLGLSTLSIPAGATLQIPITVYDKGVPCSNSEMVPASKVALSIEYNHDQNGPNWVEVLNQQLDVPAFPAGEQQTVYYDAAFTEPGFYRFFGRVL